MTRNNITKFEFTNACMFSRVMSDESICRGVLESILGIEIGRIAYRNTEQELVPNLEGKGIKLDVFAKSGEKVFDVEMQACPEKELPKRARYYQSVIDTSELKRGNSYVTLPESFIIFICKEDQLGMGAARYEIEAQCVNHPETPYDNGAHIIILNASAWDGTEDADPSGLLEYVATGADTGSKLVRDIISAVDAANSDREWVSRAMGFMSMEYALKCKQYELDVASAELDATNAELDAANAELDAANAELDAANAELDAVAAERDAVVKEKGRSTALAKALNEAGRGAEYFDAMEDPKLLDKLYKEFNL